jgi:hypothetical protein
MDIFPDFFLRGRLFSHKGRIVVNVEISSGADAGSLVKY